MFGYLGYDMVRLIERLPNAAARYARAARRHSHPPDHHRDLRHGARRNPDGVAGVARERRRCARRLCQGLRASGRRRRRSRTAGAASPALPAELPTGVAAESNMTHDEYLRDGRTRQGIYPRRRHFPGGAEPALPPAVRAAAACALPRATAAQSVAVSLSPRVSGFCHRRIESGNPGAAARRRGDDPPHRRNASARRHAGGRQPRWPKNWSPIPRSAPNI